MSTPDLNETKDIDSGEDSGGSKAAKQKKTIANEGVYKYLSLRSDTQQIRLFFVEHVNELGNPVGRLRNFTHSSAPSYQALSYTWDAETPMYHFPITGTTNSKGRGLEVRKTLWEFLRAFGKTPLHQWIWIDQLCITQDDLAERNYQAQRMGDVYAEASEVLIWLEPNTATDEIYYRPADLSKWLERPNEEGNSSRGADRERVFRHAVGRAGDEGSLSGRSDRLGGSACAPPKPTRGV